MSLHSKSKHICNENFLLQMLIVAQLIVSDETYSAWGVHGLPWCGNCVLIGTIVQVPSLHSSFGGLERRDFVDDQSRIDTV